MQQIKKKKIPRAARPAGAGRISREYSRTFFTLAVGVLLAFGVSMLFPITPNPSANAEGEPLTQSARMKAETYVYSSLALALSDNVELEITPTSGGVFTTGEATLSITTNNTTGYSVYMSTGDNSSSLLPANGLVDASISPVEGSMTSSNYTNHLNEWGYALGSATADTSYTAIPQENSAPIITSEAMAADEQYKLNFGVAVGPTLPAGTYYNSVLVSAVANPIAVHTLSGITYMQEMSPYVCDYSEVGETKQLIDTRDQKAYWVAKLKDGNCWMTQNLDLHFDENTLPLTKENTNLAPGQTSWEPTEATVIGGSPVISGTPYGTSSWYPGAWLNYDISNANQCENRKLTTGYSDCLEFFREVTPEMTPTFDAADGKSINDSNTEYDSHYLIGTFYQYNAAVAGNAYDDSSNQPLVNIRADGDICPRGWRLSSGIWDDGITTAVDRQKNTDYAKLFEAYNYSFTEISTDGFDRVFASFNDNATIDPQSAPLYFVRAGYLREKTIQSPHFGGYYWQADLGNSIDSFGLQFYNRDLYPGFNTGRALGFSVRCIAR